MPHDEGVERHTIVDLRNDDHHEAGRAALDAGRWLDARAAFEQALSDGETAEAHEGLGWALWWLCDAHGSVRHRERAFVLHRQAGQRAHACAVGVELVITYLVNLGNDAAARGWLARAQRVAGGIDPNPVNGWLWLVEGYVEPDPGRSQLLLEQALTEAQETNDVDLELVALADLGVVLVAQGRLDEGMRMLDEAMAGTMGGERRRLETVVYNCCSMLAACHLAGDIGRATQWCRVADEFMRDVSCPFLFARCRVHYGSLLFAKGQWDRADGELRAALELAESVGPGPRAEALTQLAELRIRQGRLEEAEELLSECDGIDAAVLVGAELRIARGQLTAAVELLERYLILRPDDAGRAVTLLIEAHVASGDAEAAAAAASKLEVTARADGSERQTAVAVLASARVLAVLGETDRLVPMLEDAVARFARLELPFEAARARLELALVVARTQPTTAIVEAKKALRSFERMGATTCANRASALLRSLGEAVRPTTTRAEGLTNREKEVLALVGRGLSNPEIATRLFISRKTAAHHVSHLLTKLGVRNRAELVPHAIQLHGRGSGER